MKEYQNIINDLRNEIFELKQQNQKYLNDPTYTAEERGQCKLKSCYVF